MTNLDINKFIRKIKCEYLRSKNKKALFPTLKKCMRQILDCPEHIMALLDILRGPMPLHAAVAADYFGKHGCLPDRLPAYIGELKDHCEQDFIQEISSLQPNEEYCADLHTAYSYLTSEFGGNVIPNTVEKMTEEQKKVLFQEVGNCIHAVDMAQGESYFLDPLLTYFSTHYQEKTNDLFLEENRKSFSDIAPQEETITKLLIESVKKGHFHSFRILYDLFPSWRGNQNTFTSDSFLALTSKYADTSEHYLDIAYVSMQLAKEGHTYWKQKNLHHWYQTVSSIEKHDTDSVMSYLYHANLLQTTATDTRIIVEYMPYYEKNDLFRHILPGERFPIGGIFVQRNVETILEQDSNSLKEYLEKIGENNIYHFDTELECPEAKASNATDYSVIIKALEKKHPVKDILFFYFNTHLRKVLPLQELYKLLKAHDFSFNICLKEYVFIGRIIRDQHRHLHFGISTSQFFLPNYDVSLLIKEDEDNYHYIDIYNLESVQLLNKTLHFRWLTGMHESGQIDEIELFAQQQEHEQVYPIIQSLKKERYAEHFRCFVTNMLEIIEAKNYTGQNVGAIDYFTDLDLEFSVDDIDFPFGDIVQSEDIALLTADVLRALADDPEKQWKFYDDYGSRLCRMFHLMQQNKTSLYRLWSEIFKIDRSEAENLLKEPSFSSIADLIDTNLALSINTEKQEKGSPNEEHYKQIIKIEQALVKACNDASTLQSLSKAIGTIQEEIYSVPFSPNAHRDIDDVYINTISNYLHSGHFTEIMQYLQIIENINLYHNHDFIRYRFELCEENAQLCQSELSFIMENCSFPLIKAIFNESPYREYCSLNQWLIMALRFGKYDLFRSLLEHFSINLCYITPEFDVHPGKREDYAKLHWNVKPYNFQVFKNGLPCEFDTNEAKVSKKVSFKFWDYNPEKDIVFLEKQ